MASGTQILPIYSYGTIIIHAKDLNSSSNINIELLNVIYVLKYLTNLVSTQSSEV